jgi:transposase
MEPKQWVGIDVSGKRLEVFVRPIQRILKVANSPAGLATLVSELLGIDPALIVIEATANWHLAAVAALSGAGLPVAVINPRQARNFARATGQLAKTDPIDARLLAHFAEAIHPPVRVLPDEQTQELAEWVQRRHQLVEMLTAERNRLRAMSGSARADIETHIDWLEKRLVRLDEELEWLIADKSGLERSQRLAVLGSGSWLGGIGYSDR